MEATLDLPCHHHHKGIQLACPQMSPDPLCKTTTKHQGSLWEVLKCVIGWLKSGLGFSLITLALYIHPDRMNSALHKSTREKYWFYTIHFLKYIQSKISYVSIMSCSQTALVCNYMHSCVSVYQNIQYISHSRESLKAATYLVKEWVLREDLLKGLSSQSRSINISLFTLPEGKHFPQGYNYMLNILTFTT